MQNGILTGRLVLFMFNAVYTSLSGAKIFRQKSLLQLYFYDITLNESVLNVESLEAIYG